MNPRPMLLDLFCCAGGAAVGYDRAGFDVVGVDINLQPRYPFEFHKADALQFLADYGKDFDVIHASPPCQAYTSLRSLSNNEHPRLVALTRQGMQRLGRPYVIENVPGSPLNNPTVLCGSMFGLGAACKDGAYRQLRRHRLFESNASLSAPGSCAHQGQAVGVYGHGGGRQMTRGYNANKGESMSALGIDWMNRSEISQAIPPAYTEHIGRQLLAHIREKESAA